MEQLRPNSSGFWTDSKTLAGLKAKAAGVGGSLGDSILFFFTPRIDLVSFAYTFVIRYIRSSMYLRFELHSLDYLWFDFINLLIYL